MPLELEDHQHLTAAEGYLELGMILEANEELENIDPDVRHLPEILGVRLDIYSATKKWGLMQAVAKKLAGYDPDNAQWWIAWANATRRAESIEKAKPILLDAVENHPKEPLIHFNLACYECQLGNIDAAKAYLKACFDIDRNCRLIALEDEDLEPLWDSLKSAL